MKKYEQYWNNCADVFIDSDHQALWRKHADAVNISLLKQWLPDGKVERLLKTDIFDEAVGDGLYPLLTGYAKEVVIIDISRQILSSARSRYSNLNTIVADVRHIPYADNMFDVVISNSTLDHFGTSDEIIISLMEIYRVLKQNGNLLLTLDNPVNPLIALRQILPFNLLNRLGILPYYVGITCGPRRLRQILEQVGFEIIQMSTVMHCPRVFAKAMCYIVDRYTTQEIKNCFLRGLMAFEILSRWPTCFLTGHFVAVRALRRD